MVKNPYPRAAPSSRRTIADAPSGQRALRSYTDDSHRYSREALADAPRAMDALRMLVMAPADADRRSHAGVAA